MFGEEPFSPFIIFGDQTFDLEIDFECDLFAEVPFCCVSSRPRKISSSFRPNVKGPSFSLMPHSQTIFRARSVARSMIVPRAGGDIVEHELFGHPPAHENGKVVVQEFL